ncbi:hypothetical protein HY734_03740 [Candidatus Uhrbacteria bacterium]|nr:hypothetical protein [Candidatus Uhrbacteria bacterium]
MHSPSQNRTAHNHLAARLLGAWLVGCVLLGSHVPVEAAAPSNIITYQGRLLNANGVPVSDASVEMEMRLFDAEEDGTCLWSNSSSTCDGDTPGDTVAREVDLADGLFSQDLGDTTIGDPYAAISDSVFADNPGVYLEIEIEGETLAPRKRVTAAAYAVNSQTLDGLDSAAFLAAAGDTATGAYDFTGSTFVGASALSFEGATDNGFETAFAFTDPTDDRTITFQNGSGTVAFLSDISGGASAWEIGISGTFEDDAAVIVGADAVFAYGSGGVGDLQAADELEVLGNGWFDNNLVVGASTSPTETVADAGFVLGGDDLFVAGMAGVEGNAYFDSSVSITSTLSVDGSANIAGRLQVGIGAPDLADGGGDLYVSSSLEVDSTLRLDGPFSQTGAASFSTGTGTISLNGAINAASTLGVTGNTSLSTYTASGLATLNGGISADGGVFTVLDTSGNVHTGGTLDVDLASNLGGDITLSGATPDFIISNLESLRVTDGTNTLLTIADAGTTGNVTVSGDLTVSGDDLFMGTNTAGFLLVADGTNFNPVAMTGDISMTGGGVTAVTADSVVLATDTTGNYVATVADAGSGDITVAGSGAESAAVTLDIADNALDFTELADSLLLDASLDINLIDNTATNFVISEGDNAYFSITTTNAGETMTFGNATTNPSFSFLGTGATTFSANVNANGGFDVDDAFVVADGGVLTTSQTANFDGAADFDSTFDASGAVVQNASPFVFEGGTADDFETTFAITDPTADRTITFQNGTGTVAFLTDIDGGDGLFTDGGTVTYLASTTDDFAVGANNTLVAPFSVDVSNDVVRIGIGADDATDPTLTFFASDGADSGSLSYLDDDGWFFSGGNVLIGANTESIADAGFAFSGNDFYVDDMLGVNGNAFVDGTFKAEGAVTTSSTLAVTGNTTLTGDLAVNGDDITSDGAILTINAGGTVAIQDNLTLTGDLTVSGDDLFMGTNTDGFILVADGTNFNPVAISGDITITNAGVTTIQANAITLGTDTTGNYIATVADAGSGDITVAGSGTESAAVTLDIADDALDFTELADSMTLDASFDLNLTDNTASIFTISEAANNYLTVTTTNGSETIQFGNETTNPSYGFLGTGIVTLAGDLAVNGDDITSDGATLTINAAGTVAIQDNVTVSGDITVSGDDLFMTTNTSGFILVADGTNYNPVDVSGDIDVSSTGAATVQANSVALGTDTTGSYVATVADAGSGDITVAGSGTESAAVTLDIADNALDFTELADALTLDAATSITGAAGRVFSISRTLTDATTENGTAFSFTASDTTGGTTSQYGLQLTNASSTEGLDALLQVHNADVDDLVGTALKITDAGGGFTNIIDNAGTLISGAELNLLDGGITLGELTDSGTLTAGTVDINGGAIDGTTIGATSASSGAFTTLSSTGVTSLGNNTATVAIDSSDWNINTTGDATGIGALTLDGTLTSSGTVALNGATIGLGDAVTDSVTISGAIQGTNALIFDGATDNTNELTLAITDPSADVTVTLPNATTTLAGLAVAQTFTAIQTHSANVNLDTGFDVDDVFVVADGGILTTTANGNFNAGFDVDDVFTVADGGILTTTANGNFNAGLDVDDAFVVADGGVLTTSQTANFDGAADFDSTFDASGAVIQNASPFVFEGGTANDFETTFAITDPTDDRTITFQNGSGTVAFLTDVVGGSSLFTDGGTISYLTSTTDDLAIGASNTLVAPFSVDVSDDIVRIGIGTNDATDPTITFYASDATDSGSLSYLDTDAWFFSGGNVFMGASTEAVTDADFSMDGDDTYVNGKLGVGDTAYFDDGVSANGLLSETTSILNAGTTFATQAIYFGTEDFQGTLLANRSDFGYFNDVTSTVNASTLSYNLVGDVSLVSFNNATASTSTNIYGRVTEISVNNITNTVTNLVGERVSLGEGDFANNATITNTNLIDARYATVGALTITNLRGLNIDIDDGGSTVTDARGISVSLDDTDTGSFTTGYGVYVGSVAATTAWSFFGANTAGDAAFLDDVFVGANAETISDAGFSTGGDDLFVSGQLGVEGKIFSDTGLGIEGSVAGFVGSFFNDGNADTQDGISIQACLDTNPTTDCNLIEFRDGNATIIGAIEGNGAAGVQLTSGGADYAELFPGIRTQFADGDVVGLDADGQVRPASIGTKVIGALSSAPNVLGNAFDGWEKTGTYVPVALVGQVPVRVNDEGGAIVPGDVLTLSSVPGVAKKATGAGDVLGRALEAHTSGTGTIRVFIQPGWNGVHTVLDADGAAQMPNGALLADLEQADASHPLKDSSTLSLRGSAWNGEEAEKIGMSLVTNVSGSDDYRLSIRNASDAEVAYITNAGTLSVNGDVVMGGRLYPSDHGSAQTDKYIYYDGASGLGGDFMRTNASGWATGSYDFAEMFPSEETLAPGDVVVFADAEESVRRSGEGDSQRLAGIVSTRPGFLAGEGKEGHYPIALAGRVPTKVSLENGAIEIGDPLTSSATKSGYAMKAVEAGPVVGYALEPYNKQTLQDEKIVAFVRVSYYDGGPSAKVELVNTASQTATSSNLASLNMEGNIYLGGNDILGIRRLAGLGNRWSMDEDGTLRTEGVLKTVIKSHQGEEVETAAVTSLDVVITLAGSGELVDGRAVITFEDVEPTFNDVTSTVAPIRVLVTPNGPVSLYVSEKDHDGFTVVQIDGADSGIRFDWMVSAYRKDYEPPETLELPEEEVEETPSDDNVTALGQAPPDPEPSETSTPPETEDQTDAEPSTQAASTETAELASPESPAQPDDSPVGNDDDVPVEPSPPAEES